MEMILKWEGWYLIMDYELTRAQISAIIITGTVLKLGFFKYQSLLLHLKRFIILPFFSLSPLNHAGWVRSKNYWHRRPHNKWKLEYE